MVGKNSNKKTTLEGICVREVVSAKGFDKINGIAELMLKFPETNSGYNGVNDVKMGLGDRYFLFVALDSQKNAIGYMLCEPRRRHDSCVRGCREGSYVSEVLVDDRYRKKDIGKLLSKAVFEKFRMMSGRSGKVIYVEVKENNMSANSFFKKLGFENHADTTYGKIPYHIKKVEVRKALKMLV